MEGGGETSGSAGSADAPFKVFIGNLLKKHSLSDEQDLRSRLDGLTDDLVFKAGYAFAVPNAGVTFEQFLDRLQGYEVAGRPIRIEKSHNTGNKELPVTTRLFVSGGDFSNHLTEIANLFSQYGEVSDKHFPPRESFGFVTMATQEGASRARDDLNAKPVTIGGYRMTVEYSSGKKRARSPDGHGSKMQRRDSGRDRRDDYGRRDRDRDYDRRDYDHDRRDRRDDYDRRDRDRDHDRRDRRDDYDRRDRRDDYDRRDRDRDYDRRDRDYDRRDRDRDYDRRDGDRRRDDDRRDGGEPPMRRD